MPDDLKAIDSIDELHTMEQMTQNTIVELMHQQHLNQQQIDQLQERKRHINRRLIQLLAIEFNKHRRTQTS